MDFAFPWSTQRPAQGKDRGSPDTPPTPVSFASGARAALRVPSSEQRVWAGLQNKAQAQSLSCRHPWASLLYLPEEVTVRPTAGFQLTRNLLDLTGAFKNFNKYSKSNFQHF